MVKRFSVRLVSSVLALLAGATFSPRGAAETVARVDITTFATVKDAFLSGQPLYAPPGNYSLPSGFKPQADIDVLGDLDPAKRPVFNLANHTFKPSAFSIRFQGVKFVGGGSVSLLAVAVTDQFVLPEFVILDCDFTKCAPVFWAGESVTGQVISRLEARRFTIKNNHRGFYVKGRVDDFDVTDFEIHDCGRVGLCIGPDGKNNNETIKNFMQRGYVARGVITGTKIQDVNNGQLLITGNNVVIEDMQLLDMVLPTTPIDYYNDPAYLDQYPLNSEPFYMKVDNLTVRRVYIRNDGAYQAMMAIKGASDDGGPHGSNCHASDITLENTGIRYAVGVWYQSHGDNVFERFTVIGRTQSAFIMHEIADGTVLLDHWTDIGKRNEDGIDIKVKSPLLQLTVTNSPSVAFRQYVDVPSPLDSWRTAVWGTQSTSASAALLADADGDGRPNVVEFAEGTDPLKRDVSDPILFGSALVDGVEYRTLTFTHNDAADDVLQKVQVSDDLIDWEEFNPTGQQLVAVEPGTPGHSRITVRDTVPLAEASHRFYRLRNYTYSK